jgi:hypothetical protein
VSFVLGLSAIIFGKGEVRTINLPVLLYGCETWSLKLREEHRLRAFENRALRRIFGSKTDKVTGEWRKLHNEELNDRYCSPNIFRVIKSSRKKWEGNVEGVGERGDIYRGKSVLL